MKWSDCPIGRVVLAALMLSLALLGSLTHTLSNISEAQADMRERLRAVETNVRWLCRSSAMGITRRPSDASDLAKLPN